MNTQNTQNGGHTLLEMIIVTVLFTVLVGMGMKLLTDVSLVQRQQFSSSDMQFTANRAFSDLSFYLKQTSLRYVDTRMRVKDGSTYEAGDKFPVSYAPDMMQCPSETSPYALNENGTANPDTALFSSNYSYYTTPGGLVHNTAYFSSPKSGKGASLAGKIYNNYYDPNNPGQTLCRYDGSILRKWITMDALQFPIPYNLKKQYVVGEGRDEKPDWQGYLIYAPYYNRGQKKLELRRYSIFITDFFKEYFWEDYKNPTNPLYSGATTETIHPEVKSNQYIGPETDSSPYDSTNTYNEISISGSIPKSWGMNPDSNEDKPTLHDLFDFDGDGQIETNQNPNVGEATKEWFRLYPARSLDKNGWADPVKDQSQALIFNKYEDDGENLKGSFNEMELHYFIDLRTGWTRLYYYAEWGSNKDLEIDASFIRSEVQVGSFPTWLEKKTKDLGKDKDKDEVIITKAYKMSPLFTPYKKLGSGFTGLSFSTSATYPHRNAEPESDAAGVRSSADVQIGLSLDNQVLQKGRIEFDNQTYQTTVTPLINK